MKEKFLKSGLGQELHDGVGQALTGIAFLCKAMEQTSNASENSFYEPIIKIKNSINETICKVKDISRGLTPIDIETEGIEMALMRLVGSTGSVYNVKCSLTYDPGINIKDRLIAEQFYFIASEAVTNAIRHGKANAIKLSLTKTDNKLSIAVEDNGIGFEPYMKYNQGMGIRIMRYRAQMIGADFDIKREKDEKTLVVCSIRTGI
ncbi:MAG: hypothetical protein HQL08_06145 [Nitrospirae bacterium]|nr:hypothetical protein [Nitrospirota bacterium]